MSKYKIKFTLRAPYLGQDFMFARRGRYNLFGPEAILSPNATFDYTNSFTLTDQSGWGADFATQDLGGGGVSFAIESNEAKINTLQASIVGVSDLTAATIEDGILTFDFSLDRIDNSVQPTFHFLSTGEWNIDDKRISYWIWFYDAKLYLGYTDTNYDNNVITNISKPLTADVYYTVKIETNNQILRLKVFDRSGAEPTDWDIDIIGGTYNSGEFSVKLATGSGALGTETLSLDNVTIASEEVIPRITSIEPRPEGLNIFHTGTLNADSYDYRVDGGTAVDAGDTNPIKATGLTNGQAYNVEIRAVVGGTPSNWSNVVEGTPQAFVLTAQRANLTLSGQTATLTEQAPTGTITDSAAADKQTLADIYTATGGDWETTKSHFHPGDDSNNQGTEGYYNHTGNATGWSANPDNINLDPSGTLPFGVEVELIGGEYRVVSLKLNSDSDVGWDTSSDLGQDAIYRKSNDGTKGGNNLTGTIDPNFDWQLYQCRYINLKHNYIRLEIPKKLFTPNLEVWRMNGTYEDMVPEQAPTVSNKANWVDRSNFITGTIPSDIENATGLEIFTTRGRWWGEGDEEAGGGQNDLSDQYAIGGAIPNEIVNAPIQTFDTDMCKFNEYPNSFNSALYEVRLNALNKPGTSDAFTKGIGVSQLNAFSGLPEITQLNFSACEFGVGTTDKGPFPDWSENVKMNDIDLGFCGIEAEVPAWISDGTMDGNGIKDLVLEENDLIGPLPYDAGGFGFGFSHRLGRSRMRLNNCGLGGPLPPDYIDPGVTQLDIPGNAFTGELHTLIDWEVLLDLRNLYLNGNNFTGGLPYLDWFNVNERGSYPNHPLEAFSRVNVSNSGLDLTMTVAKKPWEIQQRQRRWYYDNKSNIISNVDPNYTNSQYKQHYSASFWDGIPGSSGYDRMSNLLDQIYQGWVVKEGF